MNPRILLSVLLAAAGAAQTVDRTKPPDTPPLPPFRMPAVQEFQLPNGLQVTLLEDRRFPVLHARLGFRAGSVFDPPDLAGLSDFAAQLLKEGTASRNARRFAEECAAIGGELSAGSGADSLTASGYALSEHGPKLMALMADMVRHAAFPEEEIQLRRQNRKQELAHELSQPDILAGKKFREVIFGAHPYSRTLPTPASLDRITRDALIAFRDRYLVPNNAFLVVVGPAGGAQSFRRLVETSFGDWSKGEPVSPPAVTIPEPAGRWVLLDRPGSVQADIRVGRWAVPRSHADYFPMVVTHTVFGGGASSRMFLKIREEKGFAYDASSEFTAFRDSAAFAARTQVRNEVVAEAMDAVLSEMKSMGSAEVGPEELSGAKNYRSGLFAISLETPSAMADQLVSVKLNGLTNRYVEGFVSSVNGVTPARLKEAGAAYLDPAKSAVVIVGDARALLPKLRRFGKIEVVSE